MRLPPRPDLSWKDDGTPVDDRFGDVYFSVEDGLAETRAVFLGGCGLPDAWRSHPHFTIGELGFGTGLNFLATWQMWREHRPQNGWLNFVSFEGFPLDQADAARALEPWSSLAELAHKLCQRWPVRAKGVRQIVWPEERLTLTLHIGMIEDTLPSAMFKADAWFLDGFSPSKNESMWAERIWPEIAARSRSGTRAATFTVAGAVRRGLEASGFDVKKMPGHGRKRERLEAQFRGGEQVTRPPHTPRVAIIGAGISGATLARRLTERGAEVTVFEQADKLAQGTSGNPLALVMPRLDAADTVQARLLVDAYLSAQSFYSGRPGVHTTETVHHPRDGAEAERFQKLLSDPPLGLEQLEAIRGGGVLHKASMILQPEKLLEGLLAGIDINWDHQASVNIESRRVDDAEFDAIFLATGWHLAKFCADLDLTGRLGQVESYVSDVEAPPSALAAGHYALALEHLRLWGATFEDHDGGTTTTSDAARRLNGGALRSLNPYWGVEARNASIQSRAGVRATTADRLPLIGALPDVAAMIDQRRNLEREGWRTAINSYVMPGIFIAGGYGSRGFTWAPWAAGLLTAQLFGDPLPTAEESALATVPNRQILRRLKRKIM